jgi:hypothetical protein
MKSGRMITFERFFFGHSEELWHIPFGLELSIELKSHDDTLVGVNEGWF